MPSIMNESMSLSSRNVSLFNAMCLRRSFNMSNSWILLAMETKSRRWSARRHKLSLWPQMKNWCTLSKSLQRFWSRWHLKKKRWQTNGPMYNGPTMMPTARMTWKMVTKDNMPQQILAWNSFDSLEWYFFKYLFMLTKVLSWQPK